MALDTGQNEVIGESQAGLLSWLSKLDMECAQMEKRSKCIPGTSTWIFKAPQFVQWSSTEEGARLLWCHGLPGAGKGTIFANVVDQFKEVLHAPKAALAYVFCNWDRRAEFTALELLCSICKQLVIQKGAVPSQLVKLHQQLGAEGSRPGIDDVMLIIISLFDSFERVVICVDHLSSCEVGEDTIFVSKLQWMRNHGALVFVTSTTHGEPPEKCGCNDTITDAFQTDMQLAVKAPLEDIKACVVARLDGSADGKRLLTDAGITECDMIDQSVADCGGMFLMAQLKLDRSLRELDPNTANIAGEQRPPVVKRPIRKGRSPPKARPPPRSESDPRYRPPYQPLKAVVLPIPHTPHSETEVDLWKEALRNIQEQPSIRKTLALRTLSWVAHARVDIDLHALVQALSMELKGVFKYDFWMKGYDVRLAGEAIKKGVSEDDIKALSLNHSESQAPRNDLAWEKAPTLFDICEGLIWTRTVENGRPSACLKAWPSSMVELPELFPEANLRMATTCLQYLCRDDVLQSNQLIEGEEFEAGPGPLWVPLKKYAEQSWLSHYLASNNDQLDDLVVEYFRKVYAFPPTWLEERKPFFRDSYTVKVTDDETPLIKASRLGLNRVLEKLLLGQEYDIDAESSKRESALSAAVSAGFTSTVQILYRCGASIRYRNDTGQTLLHMAAENNDEVMVALMMEYGLEANIMSGGHNKDTPLQAAADCNSVRAATMLLDNKADMLSHGYQLVRTAVGGGFEGFVKLLVDRGFNLARQESHNVPLLSEAVALGSLTLVQYMIDNGAPVTDSSSARNSPLQRAAEEGHLDIVKLLLEHGATAFELSADENGVPKRSDSTPLEAAIWGKHQDVVDFLLPLMKEDVSTERILKMATSAVKAKASATAKLLLNKVDGSWAQCRKKSMDAVLRAAIDKSDEEVVELLLARGVSVATTNKTGWSVLHGVSNERIAKLLLENGAEVNYVAINGQTPAHKAATTGMADVLATLLDWGADITLRDEFGSTALIAAGSSYIGIQAEAVRLLLRHGADANACNDDGETVLHYAVLDNEPRLVEDILNHGIDASISSRRGGSALHFAVYKGYADIVKLLLAHGADLELRHSYHGDDSSESDDGSISSLSSLSSSSSSVRPYLARRKRGRRRDESTKRPRYWSPIEEQWTPLHSAACGGHPGIVSMLLQHGAQVSSRGQEGENSLHLAASACHGDIAAMLLASGAEIKSKTNTGDTPLHSAALAAEADAAKKAANHFKCCCHREKEEMNKPVDESKSECVALLLDHGADLACKNGAGLTPLTVALGAGHKDIVETLVARAPPELFTTAAYLDLLKVCDAKVSADILETVIGAFVETEDSEAAWGQMLTKACLGGNHPLVRLCLSKGAILEKTLPNGVNPFHQAIVDEHLKIVDVLLADGADFKATDNKGRNALHIASSHAGESTLTVNYGSRDKELIVSYLLEDGAEPNARTPEGDTALHFAVATGVVSIVNTLLKSGASVNIRNKKGSTPLHAAVRTWIFPDIVDLLLDYEACATAQDNNGFTPLHFLRGASDKALPALAQLMRKGADHSLRARNGDRPIHCAVRRGHRPLFQKLVDFGASVHDRGAKGRTVLHIAAMHGRSELMERLMEMGVDADARDGDGLTALQWAQRNEHSEAVSILLKYRDLKAGTEVGVTAVAESTVLGVGA
jgi:ankyrin repeat protein